MPEVRVRLPLDALRSRVEVGSFPDRSFAMNETKRRVGKPGNPRAPNRPKAGLVWEQEIVSSNLTTPTALRWSTCWYVQAAVNRPDTGSIPVTAALWKGKPIGDGSSFDTCRAMSLEGSTPSPYA